MRSVVCQIPKFVLIFVGTVTSCVCLAGNYAKCIVDKMPGVQNDAAAYATVKVCLDKYPGGLAEIEKGSGRGILSFDSGAECAAKKAAATQSQVGGQAIYSACAILYDKPKPWLAFNSFDAHETAPTARESMPKQPTKEELIAKQREAEWASIQQSFFNSAGNKDGIWYSRDPVAMQLLQSRYAVFQKGLIDSGVPNDRFQASRQALDRAHSDVMKKAAADKKAQENYYARERAAQLRPKCIIKDVMTDADISACR